MHAASVSELCVHFDSKHFFLNCIRFYPHTATALPFSASSASVATPEAFAATSNFLHANHMAVKAAALPTRFSVLVVALLLSLALASTGAEATRGGAVTLDLGSVSRVAAIRPHLRAAHRAATAGEARAAAIAARAGGGATR